MNRVLVAAALLLPATYLVLWSPTPVFLAATAAVGALCFWEFAALGARHGANPPVAAGIVMGVGLVVAPQLDAVAVLLAVAVGMSLLLFTRPPSEMWHGTAALAFGLIYCFLPWRSASGLREISPFWLVFALAVNWIGDAAAYYAGRAFGRHKLAPSISPGKTWEGTVASAAASVVAAVALAKYLGPGGSLPWIAALGLVANVAGQIGDLAESALKRGAAVKDSGSMLGSHGGWLDRVDATLFTLPVVHIWVRLGWW